MAKLFKSKKFILLCLIIVVVFIVTTFKSRTHWWTFFDAFFMFMAVFAQLMAITLEKMNKFAAKKLETIAIIMLILMIVALIAEAIALGFI